MPSKMKRAKGRARKVSKSRNELRNDVAGDEVKDVELELQQLQTNRSHDNNHNNDEDALLEEAINLAAAERQELQATARIEETRIEQITAMNCNHGAPINKYKVYRSSEKPTCVAFIQAFVKELAESSKSKHRGIGERFLNAVEATKFDWFGVWNDPHKLQQVVSLVLADGTQLILEGNNKDARTVATCASFLEQYRAVVVCKTQPAWDWGKIGEFSNYVCDQHTLVSFFRKRIPCNCMDRIYKEVKKSGAKLGLCCNPSCTHPKVERSKLSFCAQCFEECYCSSECQKIHWPLHKERCVAVGEAVSGDPSIL